jgi:FG-GAP-like repeat
MGPSKWTNSQVDGFPEWVTTAARVLTGDFNDDGRTDLVAFGGPGWSTIPVASSNGDGTFKVTNSQVDGFPEWVTTAARVLTGDFNGIKIP